MYYLIEWYDHYMVYDDTSNCLSGRASTNIQEAANLFKQNNWDVATQPIRNIHLTSTHLVDTNDQLKILGKFESLDNIQTTNPELFI